jgi:hypothetical protein
MTSPFSEAPLGAKTFVDQGAAFLVKRVKEIDPAALTEISDFKVWPADMGHEEPRLGKNISIRTGAHKIVLFVHEAAEYSRRREEFGEPQSHRSLMANVEEFSGPFISNAEYYFYGPCGRNISPQDTQGLALAFLACSYEATEKKMGPLQGANDMVYRLEREFVPMLKDLMAYAEAHSVIAPVEVALPVRTNRNVLRKALGIPLDAGELSWKPSGPIKNLDI